MNTPDQTAHNGHFERVDRPRHNHVTRDIKHLGECPACDAIRGSWAHGEVDAR